MTPKIRALSGVVLMSFLLVLYFVFVGIRAWALILTGTFTAVLMGVALCILPLIGVWALVRELQFGIRSQSLLTRLAVAGELPDDIVAVSASGRPDREQADALFPKYRSATERHSEQWEHWMRLGILYDACGDRSRARAAIRQAIACSSDQNRQ